MLPRKAVYAGSFDPPTCGHANIIKQAMLLFDHLYIAIASNPAKKYTFTLFQREAMLKTVVADLVEDYTIPEHRSQIDIVTIGNEFLVNFASRKDVTYLVRGIRNNADYEYERSMAIVNHEINPYQRTVFLMPPVELAEISSSLVKGLVGVEGWEKIVSKYVHPPVMKALKELATRGVPEDVREIDDKLKKLAAEGLALRRELEKRIAPMKMD